MELIQEPEPITPELYNKILSTVARQHFINIDKELRELQQKIIEQVKITDYAKQELDIFTLTTTTELAEKLKNILWS